MDDVTAVHDPNTPPAQLAEIAARRPDLWSLIDAHPGAYPGLRHWIAASRAAQAPSAQAPAQAPAAQYPATQAPTQEPAPQAPAPQYPATQAPLDQAPADQPDDAPAPRGRKGLIIGLAAGATALVLAVGGGAIAWSILAGQAAGGAATPSAAAEQLFTGVVGFDLVKTAGALSPAESQIFLPSLEALNDLGEDSDIETSEALTDLADALEVTVTEELVWDEHELATGVTRVALTAGAVTVDGDPEEIADALMRFAEPLARAYSDASGTNPAELERELAEARSEIVADIDLPQTVTVDDIRGETETDPFVVAVQETARADSDWHISPILTAGEYALVDRYGVSALEDDDLRGTIIDGAELDSPEAAVAGFTDGLEEFTLTGSIDSYAAALPLAERRFVSLYASLFLDEIDPSDLPTSFEVSGDVAVERDGERALLLPDGLRFAWSTFDAFLDRDLTGEITLTGTCWDSRVEVPIDYYGSAEPPANGEPQVETDESVGCLDAETTGIDFALLGVDDWRAIAVEEEEGWYVSTYASTGHILGILVEHLVDLIKDDELERLWARGA